MCAHAACSGGAQLSRLHVAQVRVATSKDLKEQVGSKVFFDLVDFEHARPSAPPVTLQAA